MPTQHKVLAGEGLSSIAFAHGIPEARIWDDPKNLALRRHRQERPEILAPGDLLWIPDRDDSREDCSTDRHHRFCLQGVPVLFEVRLLDDGQPRAHEPFTFTAQGRQFDGVTDPDGWVRVRVMPDAREAVLSLQRGHEVYDVQIGHVDPVETPTGVVARLVNLGYLASLAAQACEVAAAISRFQDDVNLQVTGVADTPTQEALVLRHAS